MNSTTDISRLMALFLAGRALSSITSLLPVHYHGQSPHSLKGLDWDWEQECVLSCLNLPKSRIPFLINLQTPRLCHALEKLGFRPGHHPLSVGFDLIDLSGFKNNRVKSMLRVRFRAAGYKAPLYIGSRNNFFVNTRGLSVKLFRKLTHNLEGYFAYKKTSC